MRAALHWVGFVAGLAIVLATWQSVIYTVILPRFSASRITYLTWRATYGVFLFLADRRPRYERKDRLLSLLGPASLLSALVTWMVLLMLGYALLCWPFITGDFGNAVRISGSSFFTLGVASDPAAAPTTFSFIAAASGMIVVALQIGYLPMIYGAYNRRETLVTALSARAGKPSWGPEVLARHELSHAVATLPALYAAWETLAADITESHVSYPSLTVFRSPDPLHSWVIGLLAVLDAEALHLALAPSRAPPEAIQCLRAGYICMRTLARMSGKPVNEDPRPDEPIELSYERYAFGVEHVQVSGFPVERTAAEAWADFRGWRVNYEAAAFVVADYVVAVPAPWSGRRSRMTKQEAFSVLKANRPRFRTPEDPEGRAVPVMPAAQEQG